MNVGRAYRLRELYLLLALGIVPVCPYELAGWHWLATPWTVVALIGTATALIVSFNNTQTYARTVEAQQVWTAILKSSEAWGLMSRDYLRSSKATRQLVNRHITWVTALRYQMRRHRAWESTNRRTNSEYQAFYEVPEKESTLEAELARYLDPDELHSGLASRNKATQLLGNQSRAIRDLSCGEIVINFFIEMEKAIKELLDHQGRSERLENFPYPRQYAIINAVFIRLFCILLPFRMLKEFDALHRVWLVISVQRDDFLDIHLAAAGG